MKGTIQALAIASAITLAGCSGMTQLKTENLESKSVPSWYLEHVDKGKEGWIPWDRQGFYYAVAVAVSPDMEMAMKKATLKAKAKIADRVNGAMNNRTTYTYTEAGTAENMQGRMQAQDVIVNLISDTILRTYGIDKKEVIYNPELRNYRAFVLMRISEQDIDTLVQKFEQDERIKQLVKAKPDVEDLNKTAEEVLKQAQAAN